MKNFGLNNLNGFSMFWGFMGFSLDLGFNNLKTEDSGLACFMDSCKIQDSLFETV